jgi:hypothetical protein
MVRTSRSASRFRRWRVSSVTIALALGGLVWTGAAWGADGSVSLGTLAADAVASSIVPEAETTAPAVSTPSVEASVETPVAAVETSVSSAPVSVGTTSDALTTPAAATEVSSASATAGISVTPAVAQIGQSESGKPSITVTTPTVEIRASTPVGGAHARLGPVQATGVFDGPDPARPNARNQSSTEVRAAVARPAAAVPDPVTRSARRDPTGATSSTREEVAAPSNGADDALPLARRAGIQARVEETPAVPSTAAPSARAELGAAGLASAVADPQRSAGPIARLADAINSAAGAALTPQGQPVAAIPLTFFLGFVGFAVLLLPEQQRPRRSRFLTPLERPG